MRITLHLRQSDLADLAGCSRQRANEQIGKFMQNGLIRHENGVARRTSYLPGADWTAVTATVFT